MTMPAGPFAAIVLAGDRPREDSLIRAARVPSKPLVPVGGVPMVLRVLAALDGAEEVGAITLCSPPSLLEQEERLRARVEAGSIRWVPSRETPSTSALHALQEQERTHPVLVTTADHALLTPEMVDHFCREARRSGCAVVAGLARYETVLAAYPGTRRTVTRLGGDGYCGCNLFGFLTPEAREAARFWRRVEAQRKKPWRVAGAIGWVTVLRYILGLLSLPAALDAVSARIGSRAGIVEMPFADAAVDVDSVADLELAERILADRPS
jgi:GTP:adenosylcobinamide-phosphate guanylyltransferase